MEPYDMGPATPATLAEKVVGCQATGYPALYTLWLFQVGTSFWPGYKHMNFSVLRRDRD